MAILYNGQPADPNDPNVQALVKANSFTQAANGDILLGGPQAPQTARIATDPTTAQYNANTGLQTAQQNQINANNGLYNAQSAVVPKTAAQIAAERNSNAAQAQVYDAQGRLIPLKAAQLDANGRVIDASAAANQATIGFIGQEQRATTARIADQTAIEAARNNTADQVAVGQYNTEQGDLSGRYSAGGVGAPAKVVTSGNQGGPLAPGVIGDVQTQEQRVTQEAQSRDTNRQLQLQNAQYVVDLAKTNVTAAQQTADRLGLTIQGAQLVVDAAENSAGIAKIGASNAGLDVDQANLGVTTARIASDQAGNAVRQADLNLTQAKTAPAPGLVEYTDRATGLSTWVTPARADMLDSQYKEDLAKSVMMEQGQQGPLYQLTLPQLTDLANTNPEYMFAVLDVLQHKYGYSSDAAYTIITLAKPRTAGGGGFSEADLNPGGAGAGAATTYGGVAKELADEQTLQEQILRNGGAIS